MNSWLTPTVLFVLLNLMIGTIAIISGLSTQKHHQHQQHEPQPQEHPQDRLLARSPSMLQRLKSINFYSYRSQEQTTTFHQAPEQTENIQAFRQAEQQEQLQFIRSPSILQKLKSINLLNFTSQESIPQQYSSSIATFHETQEPETHFHFPQTQRILKQEQPKEENERKEEQQQEQVEDEQIQEEDQYPDEEADQLQTLDEIYGQLKGGQDGRSDSDTKPSSREVPTKLSRKMKKSASAKYAFAHSEEDDAVESRRPATVREGKAAKATEVDNEVDAKADDFINKFKQQLKMQRLDSIIRSKEINRGNGK